MKSICIKSNDSNLLNYLLNELKNIDIKDICFSENRFKNYNNIIIHYKGNNNNLFLSKISSLLSYLVIDEKEQELLERLIFENYFYFNNAERKKILSICFDIMVDNLYDIFDRKYIILFNAFYEYLCLNKSIVLSGFINFRLKDYIHILDEITNEAVNSFIIEKEYLEFISLLKLYINSQPSGCELVHIIYSSSESILLDENKNVIVTSDDVFNAKYLSDISFSSNDYTLNSLLTLVSKKIYIHLVNNYIDEFINTLQLIFENKINLFTDCNICKIYKSAKSNSQKTN